MAGGEGFIMAEDFCGGPAAAQVLSLSLQGGWGGQQVKVGLGKESAQEASGGPSHGSALGTEGECEGGGLW